MSALLVSFFFGCVHPLSAAPDLEGLRAELKTEGGVAARLSSEAADLVILYGGEQKGSLETCGCPKRPRGSVARLAGYAEAVARQGAPVVTLNPGGFLADPVGFEQEPLADRMLQNRLLLDGLRLMERVGPGYDALNLGTADLAGLSRMEPGQAAGLPLLASQVAEWPGEIVLERGGVRIGVLGVHGQQPTMADLPWKVGAAAAVGERAADLAARTDVVVLLAWYANEEAKRLAERHPEIDVVIVAGGYQDFLPPVQVGGAVWVYAHTQTMRIGELRLSLSGGRVIGAVDRKIDLDATMPDQLELMAFARQARAELDRVQAGLYE